VWIENKEMDDGSILDVTTVYLSREKVVPMDDLSKGDACEIEVVLKDRKRFVKVYWSSGAFRKELKIDRKGIDYAPG
jgi:hypothetical protein